MYDYRTKSRFQFDISKKIPVAFYLIKNQRWNGQKCERKKNSDINSEFLLAEF